MRRVALVLLAGCAGTDGTLDISLTTAPGSTVMDNVQTLAVTLTNPTELHEIARGADGFSLSLALGASDTPRALVIDGRDASGAVIASGASPAFPVSAINAKIVVYMASPMSIGAAPAALGPARHGLGVAPLTYGAIFVGGYDAAGAPSGSVELYNVYDHSLALGLSLTVPRGGIAVATTVANNAYLFGGATDAAGTPSGQLQLFNSATAPAGAYIDFGDHPELARTGAIAARTAVDQFAVSGSPALAISGSTVVARTDVTELPANATALTATDGAVTAMFVGGPTGLVRFRGDLADMPAGDPAVTGAAVGAIGTRAIVVAGGERAGAAIDDLVSIDPITAARSVLHLAIPRAHAAIAATDRFVVIAGGDVLGTALDSVEVRDAATLAPVATLALGAARSHASAVALANGQILIVGGTDATGAPLATIELFTPPN